MRRELFNEKYGLAYGTDHICGRFIQVWKLDEKNPTQTQPDDDNLVVNKDQWFNKGLSVEEIVRIAGEYGFDLNDELNYE